MAPVTVTTTALFSARTSKADALMVPAVLIVAWATSVRLVTDTAPARPKPVVETGKLAIAFSLPKILFWISQACPPIPSWDTTAAASDRAT